MTHGSEFPKGETKARRRRRSPGCNLQTTRELCSLRDFRRIDYSRRRSFLSLSSSFTRFFLFSLKLILCANAPPAKETCGENCRPRRGNERKREGIVREAMRENGRRCQQPGGVRTVLPDRIEPRIIARTTYSHYEMSRRTHLHALPHVSPKRVSPEKLGSRQQLREPNVRFSVVSRDSFAATRKSKNSRECVFFPYRGSVNERAKTLMLHKNARVERLSYIPTGSFLDLWR